VGLLQDQVTVEAVGQARERLGVLRRDLIAPDILDHIGEKAPRAAFADVDRSEENHCRLTWANVFLGLPPVADHIARRPSSA